MAKYNASNEFWSTHPAKAKFKKTILWLPKENLLHKTERILRYEKRVIREPKQKQYVLNEEDAPGAHRT